MQNLLYIFAYKLRSDVPTNNGEIFDLSDAPGQYYHKPNDQLCSSTHKHTCTWNACSHQYKCGTFALTGIIIWLLFNAFKFSLSQKE